MIGERQLLRAGEFLIRRACRLLPAEVRNERCQEWTAELPVILHDPAVRFALVRAALMLCYAADQIRGAVRPGRLRPAVIFSVIRAYGASINRVSFSALGDIVNGKSVTPMALRFSHRPPRGAVFIGTTITSALFWGWLLLVCVPRLVCFAVIAFLVFLIQRQARRPKCG